MASENQGNDGPGDRLKARRRRYSAVEKRRLLDEAAKPVESISTVSRRYKIAPSLMFGWRKAMEAGAATGLQAEEPLVPRRRLSRSRRRFASLSVCLGRKTQETEILDALEPASFPCRWCGCRTTAASTHRTRHATLEPESASKGAPRRPTRPRATAWPNRS
jgi:transposase-like protein